MKPKRVIMRVEITEFAKAEIAAISSHTGMVQLNVTSRVLEWLCRQPQDIQRDILTRLESLDKQDLDRRILKTMAG